MELSELKRNKDWLLLILEREREGQHILCSFHEEKTGSMSVYVNEDGTWWWKCHAGCGHGTIIDAAMLKYGVNTCADALKALEGQLGIKILRDEEYQQPRIDIPRAKGLIKRAMDYLHDNEEVQEKLMRQKRGIRDIKLMDKYNIGFVDNLRFPEYFSWRFTGWVMPITDIDDQLLGIKIHREGIRYKKEGGKMVVDHTGPKCVWAPFGTYPKPDKSRKIKAKHGAKTLWPPPENWKGSKEYLFLCPGELKALALIGIGLWATSSTVGESAMPSFMVDRIKNLQAEAVMLTYDNDKAGRIWRDAMLELLEKAGMRAAPMTFKDCMKNMKPEPVRGEREQTVILDDQIAVPEKKKFLFDEDDDPEPKDNIDELEAAWIGNRKEAEVLIKPVKNGGFGQRYETIKGKKIKKYLDLAKDRVKYCMMCKWIVELSIADDEIADGKPSEIMGKSEYKAAIQLEHLYSEFGNNLCKM